jgi:hypothetical protein
MPPPSTRMRIDVVQTQSTLSPRANSADKNQIMTIYTALMIMNRMKRFTETTHVTENEPARQESL